MSEEVFAFIFFIMGLVLLFLFGNCIYNKKQYPKPLIIGLLLAALMNFMYVISLYFINEVVASITTSFRCIVNIWLILSWFCYLYYFTKVKPNKILNYFLLGLCVIDTVLLISNIFNPWLINYEIKNTNFGTYCVSVHTIYFYFHHIVGYIILLSIFLVVLKRYFKTASIYKSTYFSLGTIIVLGAIANLVFVFSKDFIIDFSVLLFGFAQITVLYYAIKHSPKILKNKMEGLILETINDIYIVFNSYGDYFYTNDNKFELFPLLEIEKGYEYFKRTYIDIPLDEKTHLFEKNINGEIRYFKANHNRLVDNGGRIQAYYFTFHDITAEMTAVRQRDYNSKYDALTGVYNRTYFLEQSTKLIQQNPDIEYYILATNFEQFRLYNDIYGTTKGDAVLIRLADLLKDIGNNVSMIYARMGSDNFGICVSKADYEKYDLANYLINTIELSHVILKIGICPIGNRTVFKAFDRAILTIHHIKGNLDKNYAFYDTSIRNQLIREGLLISAFDESIKNKHFEIYLQPQINAFDNSIIGAEALVRWRHPKYGMISPGEFIPIFEKSMHISKLDLYVWEEVCKYLCECKNSQRDSLTISVNVSRLDFYNIDIVAELKELIEKYDISSSKLRLEITESAFISNQDKIVECIKELQNLGFYIEMDDFGSGYSSLNILRKIPIDIVKLDMKFLSDDTNESKTKNILDSIITMTHRLKLPIIAEGVETLEHVNTLKQMNCEFMQGYYYARPMPISDFNEFIKKYDITSNIDIWIENDESKGLFLIFKEIERYYGTSPMPTIVLNPIYDENFELIDLDVLYQNKAFAEKENLRIGEARGKTLDKLFNDFDSSWLEVYLDVLKNKTTRNVTHKMKDGSYATLNIFPLGNTDFIVVICAN